MAVCRLSLASLLCFRQLVVIRTYFFFLNFYITASNGFINFQPQTQFLKFILLRFFFLFFLFVSKILQILGLSLEFQKFFSITRTIFSHSRSEQFWWQNTIFSLPINLLSSNDTWSVTSRLVELFNCGSIEQRFCFFDKSL